MASLPIVQPVAVTSGPPQYEALRSSILAEFEAKVPKELRLPASIIQAPPKNVTKVPRECGLLSQQELEITEKFDAVALAKQIASKKFTAVAVATAFAKRAILAHQATCCLMEWFMDEAIAQARALDAHLEKFGQTVGPLHGVPISVKEHIPLAGHYTTMGALDTRRIEDVDCQLIAILRNAGAVFYCKTIQPQSIMHLESVSAYGRVLNPYNINLSSGGSTGGEAALLAMCGSVLGIGTDIGGSIRCPAGFCGIYGFKPTSYSLPMKDFITGGSTADLNILCSTGPMCHSLRDMDLFVSVIKAAQPHLKDPRLIPYPWIGLAGASKIKTPLKIGFMMNDGVIQPQPPVTKALEWARSQLSKSPETFEIKSFEPYQMAQAMRNIRRAYWADGANALKEHLSHTGEPIFPLTQWIIHESEGPELTASQVLQQRIDRDNFRCDFAAHWATQDVDFVISPVFVGPACTHETAFYWNYTAFWNYVDYPGVVVPTPVAALKEKESYAPGDATSLSELCAHVRKLWAVGDFEGAPIALQVVARKYHDNDLFAALGVMKSALGLDQRDE
ncbi:putative amidase C550.07 [Aspergillus varians]